MKSPRRFRVSFGTPFKLKSFLLDEDAVLFVSICFLSLWPFKITQPGFRQRLRFVVDFLFMAPVVVMFGVWTIIAYALF